MQHLGRHQSELGKTRWRIYCLGWSVEPGYPIGGHHRSSELRHSYVFIFCVPYPVNVMYPCARLLSFDVII